MTDPQVSEGVQKLYRLDQAEIALAVQMRARDDFEAELASEKKLPFLEGLTDSEISIVKTNCLLRLRRMQGSFEGERA